MITFGILGPVGIGGGGGGVGTLQTVTDAGNVTTNAIQIGARLTVTNPLGTNQLVSETSAGNFINTLPKQTGLIQNSGNGLLLPQLRQTAGVYHPTRADHVIFADLSAGGISLDVDLDNALLAFPGIQVIVKVIGFNAAGLPQQALKLLPASGTIDGQSAIVYTVINLFGIRVTNDGTNWWVLDVMTGSEIVMGVPTVTLGAGSGAGAIVTIDNNISRDNVGHVTITTGTGVTANANLLKVTFATPYPVTPRSVFLQILSASGRANTDDYYYYGLQVPTALLLRTSFIINTPLVLSPTPGDFDGKTIIFCYQVVQ